MENKDYIKALVAGAEKPTIDEAISSAIALWADGSSDSESIRRRDLIRVKTKAIEDFFVYTKREAHEVTPMDVKVWRDEMEKRGLARATIYCRLSFLSSFYEWLMRDPDLGRHLRKNPVTLARPRAPKAYQTESAKALSDEQLESLKAVIRARAERGEIAALRDYALFLMFMVSGKRRSEVIRLDGQDLELGKEGIVVTYRVKGGDYLAWMISHPAVKAGLVDYLTVSGRLEILDQGGPLWVRHDRGREAARNEQPLSAWSFAKRMKQYAKEAGIKHFHLHQTRHTFGRIVSEASGSTGETREALDHKNEATTRVYVRRIAVKRDKFGDEIAKRMKL
jgi:integrase